MLASEIHFTQNSISEKSLVIDVGKGGPSTLRLCVVGLVIYLRDPKNFEGRDLKWGPRERKEKILEHLFAGNLRLKTTSRGELVMQRLRNGIFFWKWDRINHARYILLTLAWWCWFHSLPLWGLAMVPWKGARWRCFEWGSWLSWKVVTLFMYLVDIHKNCQWSNKDP